LKSTSSEASLRTLLVQLTDPLQLVLGSRFVAEGKGERKRAAEEREGECALVVGG